MRLRACIVDAVAKDSDSASALPMVFFTHLIP